MPGEPNSGRNGEDSDGAIHSFAFRPPSSPVESLEIVELAALRRRLAVGVLERVHRVEFHTLTLVTEGSGQHTADFVA